MGAIFSRDPKEKKNRQTKSIVSNNDKKYHGTSNYEILERDFHENPNLFILNQLLLSFMFYKSDEEFRELSRKRHRDRDINPTLLKEHQKSCVKVDNIAELVNTYIKFKPRHGPKKDVYENLLPRRMYILHENIEILSDEEDHYSGIDKPSCKAKIIEHEREGYVLLQHIPDGDKSKISINSSSSGTSTNSPILTPNDSELEYGEINDARTPKPIDIATSLQSIGPVNVRAVRTKNCDADDSALYKITHYIDSNEFMKFFRNNGFRTCAASLNINEDEMSNAVYTKFCIHCQAKDNDNTVEWEIIPAVQIKFPENEAYQLNKRKNKLKWPINAMITEMLDLDCVLLPRGYIPKRGENKDQNIEWEIGFPKVERYLESKMHQCQLKAFLFLCTLHKTFIEPKTQKQGLVIDHLRNLIFREQPSWSETRLGTRLIKLIKSLMQDLGKETMSDYFITKKNIFDNVPGRKLRVAQKQLSQIVEAPVMHFILALRNLHYSAPSFYPVLDYDKLCNILRKTGYATNNQAITKIAAAEKKILDKKNLDPDLVWKEKWKQQKLGEKKKPVEEEVADNLNEALGSTDSIELMWKKDKFDPMTQTVLIEFFIDHFLEIVTCSIDMGITQQAELYLKQTSYLLKLVKKENPSYDFEKREKLFEKLNKKTFTSSRTSTLPPVVPVRNSIPRLIMESTRSGSLILDEAVASTSKENKTVSFDTSI